MFEYISAIGQDSHRFDDDSSSDKYGIPLILGGVLIPDIGGFKANSDGDVILHSLVNAISGISCVNILGKVADDLCFIDGITDSKEYLSRALQTLKNEKIIHVSFSVECKRPILAPFIDQIRKSIAALLNLSEKNIGFTATSGEGLTDFGRGLGIQSLCSITVKRKIDG